MSPVPSAQRRATLAKTVIVASALVALATSAPGPWSLSAEDLLRVPLDERSEQRVLLTIELAGPLYAATGTGDIELLAITDRAATDFTLEATALTPDTLEASPRDGNPPDAGAPPARPSIESPNRASLWLALTCAEPEPPERSDSCLAQAEIRVARESARALSAQLSVTATITGEGTDPPSGTFVVQLEEIAP